MTRNNSRKSQYKKRYTGIATRIYATDLVYSTIVEKKNFDASLDKLSASKKLDDRDRKFAHHIATTTLRHYGRLSALVKNELAPQRRNNTADWLIILLATALAQLIILKTPPHAVTNSIVEAAKQKYRSRKVANFVNALLRRIQAQAGEKFDALGVKQDLPFWLREKLKKQWGEGKLSAILTARPTAPPLHICAPRVNAAEIEACGLKHICHDSFEAMQGSSILDRLNDSKNQEDSLSHFWVQDVAAGLPVHLLGDLNGKIVLEFCAAPGGKTAQLAAKGARIIAIEQRATRAQLLQKNLARLGREKQVEIRIADGRNFKPETHNPQLYDLILLDAPCSAVGTLRRHPDVVWTKNVKQIRSITQVQEALIHQAFSLLAPGGTMIYAICSWLEEEGADLISKTLSKPENHPFFRRPIGENEIDPWDPEILTPEGDIITDARQWQAFGGADGFFISRIQRKS